MRGASKAAVQPSYYTPARPAESKSEDWPRTFPGIDATSENRGIAAVRCLHPRAATVRFPPLLTGGIPPHFRRFRQFAAFWRDLMGISARARPRQTRWGAFLTLLALGTLAHGRAEADCVHRSHAQGEPDGPSRFARLFEAGGLPDRPVAEGALLRGDLFRADLDAAPARPARPPRRRALGFAGDRRPGPRAGPRNPPRRRLGRPPLASRPLDLPSPSPRHPPPATPDHPVAPSMIAVRPRCAPPRRPIGPPHERRRRRMAGPRPPTSHPHPNIVPHSPPFSAKGRVRP